MTALRKQFGGSFIEGYPLASLTTIKVGGPSQGFLTITNIEDLKRTMSILRGDRVPHLIIGKGSNLIIPDEGIRGLTIQLKGEFENIRIARKTRNAVYLRAGSGVTLPSLISYASNSGLSGLEPFIGIPATVGGAVRMNAGIPGFSISGILSSVTCLHPSLKITKLYARRLHPTYRDMRLPGEWIILDATFILIPAQKKTIQRSIKRFQKKREGQRWRRYPTAGSVFRNPEGASAGQIIEDCGLIGYQVGDAQISKEHANIIINKGHATAKDIIDLISLVRERVLEKTGIKLDLEVIVAGS